MIELTESTDGTYTLSGLTLGDLQTISYSLSSAIDSGDIGSDEVRNFDSIDEFLYGGDV
jgi:hypothetical protein